jgi:hypothetical protein
MHGTDIETFTHLQLRESRANDFVKMVSCLMHGITHGNGQPQRLSDEMDLRRAAERHQQLWPRSINADLITKIGDWRHKTAVNPGTTLEPSWAAPLAPIKPLGEVFVDLARPASLIGKLFGTAARVPFNISVPTATGGGTYRWVGQGAPKPVGHMQLATATLPPAKAAGMIVVTKELIALTAPASVATLRREMVTGMSAYLDAQLTDPTVAAVVGVNPASITNGAPSIASAGTSAANAATDVKKLIETFTATNPNAASMALLMSPGVAVALAIATNSQTLGPNGGTLFGVPTHTGAIGSRVVILDPSALLVADDGDIDVTIAQHASVEMDTAPTSPVTSGTVMVNLWQAGLVGLKIDRFVNWKMARANAVLYTNVAYA